jgi:23S rRNA pseudouridine1911/1915/1917 synthase
MSKSSQFHSIILSPNHSLKIIPSFTQSLILSLKIDILHEDSEILVVNKPSGIPTQPDKNGTVSLLEILSENRPNLYLIHRLDQRVSGIVIFAKTEQSASQLSKDFNSTINNRKANVVEVQNLHDVEIKYRNITKKYRVIVSNKPSESEAKLTHWLLKDTKKNLSKAFENEVQHSQKSELLYKVIQSSERYHLLEIELLTGRFHQIRTQLSAIGSPILGDLKYGYKRSSPDGSIFLQSYHLSLNHPITKQATNFEIEMPVLWKNFGF